jgi:hypothetical protein
MGHSVSLFVAAAPVLDPFRQLSSAARFYTLTPNSPLVVLPYDEPVQEAVHRRFGTGDWPAAQSVMLSTTDQSFAAECSQRGPLAYLETDYFGGIGRQSAALWQAGGIVMAPATLESDQGARRPPSLRPINMALRTLGVAATPPADEFAAFGLMDFRSNDAIHRQAWPYRP